MAKKFLYVCAGLLMLVCAYELGASRAEAQMQNTIWFASRSDYCAGVNVGRTLRFMHTGVGASMGSTFVLPPVPGTAEIVAFNGTPEGDGQALLADGSVYVRRANAPDWTYVGNLLSGATAVPLGSWGALKVKYR